MLRVNPKVLADLGLGGSLINGEGEAATQTGEVFTKLGAKKCFKDGDANKDGVITQDEVNISAAAYAKLDANSDGKVTEEEMSDAMAGQGSQIAAYYLKYKKAAKSSDLLEAILTGGSSTQSPGYVEAAAKKYIANKDANKNGTLEQSEISISAETFSKLDTDKSGSISLAEMKAALKGQDARLAAYFKSATSEKKSTDLTSKLLGTI